MKEFLKSAIELGGESRTLAEALQAKLDAGQAVTDEELGRLALTAEAEQAEWETEDTPSAAADAAAPSP